MKNNYKSNSQGITLLALIITIIVLVILAGVTISTLVGNDGIIKNADNAVGKYNESSNDEQKNLNSMNDTLEEYTTGKSTAKIEDYDSANLKVDENGLATANIRIKPSTDNPNNLQIIIPKGFAPAILQTGTLQSLPGEDGKVKKIMPAENWNTITATDINKGIVLVDYTITYDGGKNSGTVPDFNEFVWIPMPDSNKFERVSWLTAYGFDEDGNWNGNGTLTTGQPLANEKDAIKKSTNYNITLHSHLIYGIEWDSILNWLNGNASVDSGGNDPQKSGKSEYWKANNIYDMAGNVYEWTQEKWSIDTKIGNTRGGYCGWNGYYHTAASRGQYPESTENNVIGFRYSFYL